MYAYILRLKKMIWVGQILGYDNCPYLRTIEKKECLKAEKARASKNSRKDWVEYV